MVNRLATFVGSPTKMYGHDPQGPGIEVYRKLVSALVLLLPAYVVASTVSLLRRRRWPWLDLRWWLAASTLSIALLVTLGEQGEEARFLFTILPMLLAVAGFAIDDLAQKLRAREPQARLRQRRTRLRLVLRTNCKLAETCLNSRLCPPTTSSDRDRWITPTSTNPASPNAPGTCAPPYGNVPQPCWDERLFARNPSSHPPSCKPADPLASLDASGPRPRRASASTEALALEHVRHRYSGMIAVDDVSLSIAQGEIMCLVGPSGCGKSTLLRIAAGLEALQRGTVRINGKLVADDTGCMPPDRRGVGLVFQDYALFPHLSVIDNVRFGLSGQSGGAAAPPCDGNA